MSKLLNTDLQAVQAAEAIRAQKRLQRHREWRALAELARRLNAIKENEGAEGAGRRASGYAREWASRNAVAARSAGDEG
jgi:hypothetical protein